MSPSDRSSGLGPLHWFITKRHLGVVSNQRQFGGFAYQLAQSNMKGNIKVLHHQPWMVHSPRKWPVIQKVFYCLPHHHKKIVLLHFDSWHPDYSKLLHRLKQQHLKLVEYHLLAIAFGQKYCRRNSNDARINYMPGKYCEVSHKCISYEKKWYRTRTLVW